MIVIAPAPIDRDARDSIAAKLYSINLNYYRLNEKGKLLSAKRDKIALAVRMFIGFFMIALALVLSVIFFAPVQSSSRHGNLNDIPIAQLCLSWIVGNIFFIGAPINFLVKKMKRKKNIKRMTDLYGGVENVIKEVIAQMAQYNHPVYMVKRGEIITKDWFIFLYKFKFRAIKHTDIFAITGIPDGSTPNAYNICMKWDENQFGTVLDIYYSIC